MGFMIHDMDCDGFISPQDVVDFQLRYCTDSNCLISYDITELTRHLKAKMALEPKVEPTSESILIDAAKKLEKFDPYAEIEEQDAVAVSKLSH